MLEETRQRFKIQLQKEVSAQSQISQEHYDKEKNPFFESGLCPNVLQACSYRYIL
jgi:hypothetical protein